MYYPIILLVFYREKKYDIEGESLDGKYKDWQKKLHPDLVHTKSQVGLGSFKLM